MKGDFLIFSPQPVCFIKRLGGDDLSFFIAGEFAGRGDSAL